MTDARLNAVTELTHYDHRFLHEDTVKRICKPFGFEGNSYLAQANSSDFKGLTLVGGAREARGAGADEVAESICRYLGLSYQRKFGRGSQLYECCDVIRKFVLTEIARGNI